MKYVIGIDGGGTKTRYVLADEIGSIIGISTSGGTNYYLSSIEAVGSVLKDGIDQLLWVNNVDKAEIGMICYALAGMDSAEDFNKLEGALDRFGLGGIPHFIENDVWTAFNAQTTLWQGSISICGTGHNTAVRNDSGVSYGIPSCRYPLGNHGGGREICDCALNAAFLSRDHTGPSTELERYVAQICDCESMEELQRKIIDSNYTYQYSFPVAKTVSTLAIDGDEVCRSILAETGRKQGEMTGYLAIHAGLRHEAFPAVLAGSVYCQEGNTYIIQGYCEGITEHCYRAKIQVLEHDPAEGAVLHAINRIKHGLGADGANCILERIHETWSDKRQ